MTTVSRETARVQALYDLADPNAPQSLEIEAIVAEAAEVAGVPMASINLLDSQRQYVTAALNFPGMPTPRSEAMCDVTLRLGAFVLVEDARADPRFAASPWVDGRRGGVRFYASAPLLTRERYIIGTLCAFDIEPHTLSDEQVVKLKDLADRVISTFETERALRQEQ